MKHLAFRNLGYLVLVGGFVLGTETMAQTQGRLGVTPGSAYRMPATSKSTNMSFGSAGLSPGSSLNSNFGNRIASPTLSGARRGSIGSGGVISNRSRQFGNGMSRNKSPVLSPYLNMLPGATSNFSGQYLLRTQPFEAIDNAEQNMGRQLGALQQDFQTVAGPQRGAFSGDPFMPIRSGLTPTGHAASFLNTGSYYP